MSAVEINFDGLVGPNHNYAGLSFGNLASLEHAQQPANPKQAALQGLQKMRLLMDLGIPQAVLPPHPRPAIHLLRALGFSGNDITVLQQAYREQPRWFAACYSSSSMWTANAATVSPSMDSADHRVHFSPANLMTMLHRSLEWPMTRDILRSIFADDRYFVVHDALPTCQAFADEGAANHSRFARNYADPGVQFFVFGRYAFDTDQPVPQRYPARHTYESCQAITKRHQLLPSRVVYAQQHPHAIDQGVFHNDVIAVGDRDCLLYHEQAFIDEKRTLTALQRALGDTKLHAVKITSKQLSVTQAVNTYLFNSQLVTVNNKRVLIAPIECENDAHVKQLIEKFICQSLPLQAVHYIDCRQSMHNGGGPACLRLRVVLTESEIAAMTGRVLLDPVLHHELIAWVERHYRDRLTLKDLLDPQLMVEIYIALDELTDILELGTIYPFQQ
ncbi:MAG: N-succinylarginine dihydrolase [Gammaproteobacteria bacterium]